MRQKVFWTGCNQDSNSGDNNRAGKDGVELKNLYYCLFILCCSYYNINNKDGEEKLVVGVSKSAKKNNAENGRESIRARKFVLTFFRYCGGNF